MNGGERGKEEEVIEESAYVDRGPHFLSYTSECNRSPSGAFLIITLLQ
jgi:hypothetical protein